MKGSELDELLGSGSEKSFDFRATYYAIKERLWLVVLSVLLLGTAAAVYVTKAPLIYAAQTVLMVEQEESKVIKIEGVTNENLGSAELVNTLLQTLESRVVLQRVVERLGLHKNPDFLLGTGLTTTSPEVALEKLKSVVKVTLRKGTRLVNVLIEHRDPEVARIVADGLVKEFLRYRFEQKSANTVLASEFLIGEADRLKEQLQKSEEALHKYKVQENAGSLQENQNTVVAVLQDLNEKFTQARSERMRLEGDVARAKELAGKPNQLVLLPSVAAHPAVASVNATIAEKEAEIAVLSQRYKSKHPKYVAAYTQLASLRDQRNQVVGSAAELLSASFRSAQETEAEFARALQDQEKRSLELSEKAIPYNVLTREMESNRTMYESVLARLKETDVTKELDQTQVRVVESAFSFGPVRPDKPKILIAGLLGGLIVGIGLAFGLSLLDTSVKTVDDAEEVLGLPVLAAVPRLKGGGKNDADGGGFPVLADPKGTAAEAFRSLRSSLALLGRQDSRRTFLFTSAVPSEGKTFTCSNYALVSAQQGISTLLIDADLRRPSVSKLFYGEARKPGLSDCLAGQAGLKSSVCDTDLENLKVLTAGSTAPNPAELLASDDFPALLKEALLHYDRVIIDTAPINAVSDTLMLAPHVQTICLVVRAASTPKAAAQRACKALEAIKCKPAGLVLNRLPQGHGAGYYYYYSAGEYGSEGVYGAKA